MFLLIIIHEMLIHLMVYSYYYALLTVRILGRTPHGFAPRGLHSHVEHQANIQVTRITPSIHFLSIIAILLRI